MSIKNKKVLELLGKKNYLFSSRLMYVFTIVNSVIYYFIEMKILEIE